MPDEAKQVKKDAKAVPEAKAKKKRDDDQIIVPSKAKSGIDWPKVIAEFEGILAPGMNRQKAGRLIAAMVIRELYRLGK